MRCGVLGIAHTAVVLASIEPLPFSDLIMDLLFCVDLALNFITSGPA
jgi:hypothetical protein